MHPAKTLVVDCPSQQPLPVRHDWYPNAQWVHRLPTAGDLEEFLDGVDVVYTAETGYGHALWDIANRRGIKTVLHANFEFLNRHDQPTVWAAPSMWHIGQWPEGTIHLPVPIETDRFPTPEMPDKASRFLHIVGRPTVNHDGSPLHRNGTVDVIKALQRVSADIEVTFRCQQPGYVEALLEQHPVGVKVTVEAGDTPNYWDNYTGQDVLLMPRRFGGLCLPVNEALGAGMPVVMTDINPNNTWLPQEWLVATHHAGEFTAKQRVTCHRADPEELATAITRMTEPDFYRTATLKASRLRDRYSWDTVKPRYMQVFG
jgi:glycosyltransferase involved in cell wall biosynthesis